MLKIVLGGERWQKYTCNECGGTFSESEIDWEVSEKVMMIIAAIAVVIP